MFTRGVADTEVFGKQEVWVLLGRASSKQGGFMKATRALEIPKVGCLVKVSTELRNTGGGLTCSDSIIFVPGITLKDLQAVFAVEIPTAPEPKKKVEPVKDAAKKVSEDKEEPVKKSKKKK